MKTRSLFCSLCLLIGIYASAHAALTRQNNILGKFIVTSVKGTATCVSEGRILELKKGDTIVARGTTIETAPGSNAVLVFSNGTGVFADEKTQLRIDKFDQEFFTPNNNLRVEPSNSSTVVKLNAGRVLVSTPRLLGGTTMAYQTLHASVMIRGEKILIETTDKQTHVAMISGNATVNPRDAQGNFVSIGKRLVTGQEAFVKYTIRGAGEEESASVPAESAVTTVPSAPAASEAAATPAESSVAAPPTPETGAVVLKLSGTARSRLPDTTADTEIAVGSVLQTGSIVTTGDSSELHIQTFAGAISTILSNSIVQIEQLSRNAGSAASQSATLALKSGTLVSTIDPAGRSTNEYMVRTLQGTARAQGTAFATSLEHGGFSLAATADTVKFTTASGTSYEIAAGNVVLTGPARYAQPPIPLAQAIAADPTFEAVIRAAFSTVTTIIENDVGGLSPGSSLNLLSKVAASVTTALPDQAEQFVSRAVTAIATPASSLNGQISPATAAILHAVVAARPDRAAQIAAAAAVASPGQAAVIAAAAAKAAPAQAASIAAAVAQTVIQTDPTTGITPASLQTAAAIAAAVATSVPSQAGQVAAATMQTVVHASPNAAPDVNARRGSLIAATVTRAAPTQAIQIARAMMKALVQELTEATPQILAQTAALLAGSIIAVVPPQAQPVATAVMQFLSETYPNASDERIAEVAGVLAATLAQLVPDGMLEIYAGIADALGRPVGFVTANAARFADLGARFASEASSLGASAALALQQSTASTDALNAGLQLAQSPFAATGSSSADSNAQAGTADSNTATSIIVTQFDPAAVSELTSDLEAAQAAQSTVQFYTEPSGDGGTTVRPSPTVPRTLPVETVVSPSRLGV